MSTPPRSANIAPSLLWALLSPFGRIGREPYWLCFAFVWVVIAIALKLWLDTLTEIPSPGSVSTADIVASNPLFPFLFLILQWIELALLIKRLQDIGQSGFLALLKFIPFLNVLMVFFLGFVPSKKEPNRHGPLPNSYWRKS